MRDREYAHCLSRYDSCEYRWAMKWSHCLQDSHRLVSYNINTGGRSFYSIHTTFSNITATRKRSWSWFIFFIQKSNAFLFWWNVIEIYEVKSASSRSPTSLPQLFSRGNVKALTVEKSLNWTSLFFIIT